MIDELKTYFMEVVLKKYGPAFVKGGIAWLFVYLGAHQGLLNSLGITWDKTGHTVDIDLDALSAWAYGIGSGAIMVALTAAQHHTTAVLKGQPQDGTHQRATDPVVEPPKGA